VAAEPEGVAAVPSAGEVFVADAGANLVRVVSSSGPREVADIPVGTQPAAIVYAAARGLVYVSDSGSGQVSVLDAATHRRVATVSLGRSVVPTAMAYVPDRSELWVADAAFPSSGIFVVSTSTNRVVANVSVDAWGTPAGGMAYDPVDHRILLVETQANRLVSIRTADRGVVATASTKFQPLGALYDPVARIFLVGESNFATAFVPPFTSRVYEVAAATLRNGSSVGVGPGPSALARDPATGDILVAITAGNRVAVLTDTAGLRLVATVSTAQAPDAFAALGPAGPVWVANYASGSISILRD
jgi:YVTN family beta-propeller protein